MKLVSVDDIRARGKVKAGNGVLGTKGTIKTGSTLGSSLAGSKISKNEGIDELLQCLNPATFDFACIVNNLKWLFNSTLNNVYLNCSLGPMTPIEGQPGKYASSGACYSWWGVAGIAQPQRCADFDSIGKSFETCKNKCTAEGKSYHASGCDGQTIWCQCSD